MSRPIPAILSVDVEPDGFQLSTGSAATTGYDAAAEHFATLRDRLADATGRPVSFAWFFRMDPQIRQVYGRADHLVSGYGDRVARLLDAGDKVGLHTHPIRWDDRSGLWTHEITDLDWLREAYETSFAAFEQAFGAPCERHRTGGGIYDQFSVDTLERLGTKVESGLELRPGWRAGQDVNTGVDASPISAASRDCLDAPRQAYRPSAGDFMRAGDTGTMVMLPATTSRLQHGRPWWRTVGGTVKRRRLPQAQMLYPDSFNEPSAFWDLVTWQLRLMRRPYVNIAIRTDAPDSRQFRVASKVFAALADHPLARRLEIVDPLVAAQRLLGEPALI